MSARADPVVRSVPADRIAIGRVVDSWTVWQRLVGAGEGAVMREGRTRDAGDDDGRSRRAAIGVVLLFCIGAVVILGAWGAKGFADTFAVRRDAAVGAPGKALCSRYASTDGRDDGRGTRSRPFKTAQRLADSLRPGQVGCVRAGLYDETRDGYVLRVRRGGVNGKRVTIRSHPGERAKLVGIVEVRSNHATLQALDIEGTGGANTVKVYGDDFLLQDSEVTNLGRGDSCVILGSTSGGVALRPIVRRNRFHDCGDPYNRFGHGIYASQVADGRIVDNVFWNPYGYAITIYPNSQRTLVARNVIDGGGLSRRGGISVGGDDVSASNDNIIERNVIAYAATYGVKAQDVTGSGNIIRRNCFWRNTEGDTTDGLVVYDNVVAPPLFVDRAKRDYRLRKASRCRAVVGPAKAHGAG
jgi:hypothetical protein